MGSFSSESGEIFDEVATAFSKIIAEGAIFEKNRWQDRGKIPDAERDEPKTQVNSENPMFFTEARKILIKNKKKILQLGAISLAVFGSISRNEGTVKSDIDILIDFDSKKGLFAFIQLRNYLTDLLGCKVDLVTKNALHPALKKRILREAKNVF